MQAGVTVTMSAKPVELLLCLERGVHMTLLPSGITISQTGRAGWFRIFTKQKVSSLWRHFIWTNETKFLSSVSGPNLNPGDWYVG